MFHKRICEMKTGRPTDYTPKLAQEICDVTASTGSGLPTLCRKFPHWPTTSSIYLWLRKHSEFSDKYYQAKKDQVNVLVDEILEISDNSARDDKVNSHGDTSCDSEWVARSRLRIDTRKWLAAKLVPRLYGDNVLGRELSDEIAEFKKQLEAKGVGKNGNTESSETE